MREWLFLPEQASTIAGSIDAAYLYLWAITILFTAIVYTVVLVAVVKYRRRAPGEVPQPRAGSIRFEIMTNAFILLVFLSAFVVGTVTYFQQYQLPADATFDIHVVGKQWMWQFQHPTGQREINELHVPVHTKVRVTLTTEDVIHSLFLPAFRVKRDAVPGMYTQMWFEATQEGAFPLYCAEYCGLQHAKMIGRVIVMDEADYQNWAAGEGSHQSPVEMGNALFERLGCTGCHGPMAQGDRCPPLTNVFGATRTFQDGSSMQADESYIRESIVRPQARIVEGYPSIMPTFQGQLTEVQIMQLVTFIKSLSPAGTDAIETTIQGTALRPMRRGDAPRTKQFAQPRRRSRSTKP